MPAVVKEKIDYETGHCSRERLKIAYYLCISACKIHVLQSNFLAETMPKQSANIRDGHILTSRRTGKARSDAYLKRGPTLTKLGEQLHEITGAHVKVHVLPTWPKGKQHLYKSQGFPILEQGS